LGAQKKTGRRAKQKRISRKASQGPRSSRAIRKASARKTRTRATTRANAQWPLLRPSRRYFLPITAVTNKPDAASPKNCAIHGSSHGLRVAARSRRSDDGLLFATIEGKPLSPNAVSAAWADFCPEVTFHALRHTHASQLIDAGVDIVTISKRLGHAKPDITLRIYAHLFKKDDSKAAAAINASLGS
jgi:Phage integrase family